MKNRKKERIQEEYGSEIITEQNEKIFYGENGKVSVAKYSTEESSITTYTRITKEVKGYMESKEFEISFVQHGEIDEIIFKPKIVDIAGQVWGCNIVILKSNKSIICSANIGSMYETCYTGISAEDYHKILNAFEQALDPNQPFRLREDVLEVMYEINNLQIQTFVEMFGSCLGFYGICPIEISVGQPLIRKRNVNINENE